MSAEELHYRRSEIRDRLSYLMLHAPDFPSEDSRLLSKEREEMLSRIARYESDYPDAKRHPRFMIFKMELDTAFEAAAVGSSDVTRLFQIAGERFEETFQPPKAPDLIAGPSGITKL